jgi:hypothetical protein
MTEVTWDDLDRIEALAEEWRAALDEKAASAPWIRIWRNRKDGQPGLEYVGRIDYQDTIKASFPFKKNQSAQGVLELRLDHYISEWLRTVPNDPEEKKNVIITVDFFGSDLRWSGILHHHSVKMRDGLHYMELTFNDDLQFLQFMLGPPNPVLPIPIFQFPRVGVILGPAKWACSMMVLINIIRLEGNLWTLPDDPFDLDQWFDIVQWDDWQIHIKCSPFLLDDSSLWTMLSTRMNPLDTVLADALEDAQLTLRYRRVFSDLGETQEGLIFVQTPANGALVLEIVDDSGYYSPLTGTFLEGTIADGFIRSAVTYVGGFVEDTASIIGDDQSMYPDEYWHGGFLGTFASAPWLVIRDNPWTQISTSELTWSPATAVSVIVGGDNPAADAIARLIIETTGNLLGYLLLFGFSSAGTIAADVIMPFLQGTIAAWLEWKNTGRAKNLGWVHLHELFQQGAEANSWSLAAVAALRGGFLASRSQTSHALELKGTRWIMPGVHFWIGSRVGSTSVAYPDMIFVNQVEYIEASWDWSAGQPLDFTVQIGQNKAAMSVGERSARLVKKIQDTLQNIGVHLIS